MEPSSPVVATAATAGAVVALACGAWLSTPPPSPAGSFVVSAGKQVQGGCLCGALRYTLSTPAKQTYHCHCLMCRKIHGALFATFSVYPKTSWQLTSGEVQVYYSSPGVTRQFCGTCGCQITSTLATIPDEVYVATGSMDADIHPGHTPENESHIFADSRTCWKDFATRDADGVASWASFDDPAAGDGISVDDAGRAKP